MIILDKPISIEELKVVADQLYGDMVKAVAPEMEGEDFIEFDSLINIRPRQNNRSRYVESEEIREKISGIACKFISR